MAEAEIISLRDVPSPMPTRLGMIDKEVQFRIDSQGPFFVYLPVEEYTPEKALAEVRQKLAEWTAVVGKKVSSR